MNHSTAYATVADLATKFNVSPDAVYRKVESKTWPASRIGRMIRFSPEQQDEINRIVTEARPAGYRKDRIRQALQKLSA